MRHIIKTEKIRGMSSDLLLNYYKDYISQIPRLTSQGVIVSTIENENVYYANLEKIENELKRRLEIFKLNSSQEPILPIGTRIRIKKVLMHDVLFGGREGQVQEYRHEDRYIISLDEPQYNDELSILLNRVEFDVLE